MVPGLTDFMIFKIYNRVADVDLYGGKLIKKAACRAFMSYIQSCQKDMIQALERSGRFRAPGTFDDLHKLIHGYLGDGNKMGEGWLLTAEMLELIHTGTGNIVCTQPFGCLPNHIVGKGMIRKLKDDYPMSNIVAIDYDPGARITADRIEHHAGQRQGPGSASGRRPHSTRACPGGEAPLPHPCRSPRLQCPDKQTGPIKRSFSGLSPEKERFFYA